ncbi:hypothetical protein V6N12_069278 [Hibiscus sabdariffa]|uniref:Uncharacterized protein n=1 Tax=Hibiscus sabdariffa TaxID=183260 RepID=A0ABR2FDF0_9ROSI
MIGEVGGCPHNIISKWNSSNQFRDWVNNARRQSRSRFPRRQLQLVVARRQSWPVTPVATGGDREAELARDASLR